jgi:hypothetical protein
VQEMMDFLDTKCESAGIFFTDIMLKEHVLDPSENPKGWRYPEMKKNVLRRVRVYRVKD